MLRLTKSVIKVGQYRAPASFECKGIRYEDQELNLLDTRARTANPLDKVIFLAPDLSVVSRPGLGVFIAIG